MRQTEEAEKMTGHSQLGSAREGEGICWTREGDSGLVGLWAPACTACPACPELTTRGLKDAERREGGSKDSNSLGSRKIEDWLPKVHKQEGSRGERGGRYEQPAQQLGRKDAQHRDRDEHCQRVTCMRAQGLMYKSCSCFPSFSPFFK